MGPLVALGALIPALVSTAASIPMIIGSLGGDSPPPPPEVDVGMQPLEFSKPKPPSFGQSIMENFKQQPYVFGSGEHLSVDPTLGNFGGIGSGSIQDRLNARSEPTTQLSNFFKPFEG